MASSSLSSKVFSTYSFFATGTIVFLLLNSSSNFSCVSILFLRVAERAECRLCAGEIGALSKRDDLCDLLADSSLEGFSTVGFLVVVISFFAFLFRNAAVGRSDFLFRRLFSFSCLCNSRSPSSSSSSDALISESDNISSGLAAASLSSESSFLVLDFVEPLVLEDLINCLDVFSLSSLSSSSPASSPLSPSSPTNSKSSSSSANNRLTFSSSSFVTDIPALDSSRSNNCRRREPAFDLRALVAMMLSNSGSESLPDPLSLSLIVAKVWSLFIAVGS